MKPNSRRNSRNAALALAACSIVPLAATAQTMKAPDITRDPTLYVVPYAHLDTQWRWELPQSISQFLLKTLRVNFDFIDKYPHYVFNWTGANRYRLMKEYYPNDYARMKQYVAAGRWFPAGSSVEEGDVNLPSAEGIFRQILYGNTYFRNEFGKASYEYMLPDCFGFPASLPSILAHAGVKGFSTQKLSSGWQPAPIVGGPDSPEQTPVGIPFNVGKWIGPDGHSIIAALNPEGYGSQVFSDLSKAPVHMEPVVLTAGQKATLSPQQQRMLTNPPMDQDWPARIQIDGRLTGVYADYHYVGTGDVGGAANESSVKLLEETVTKGMASLPDPKDPLKHDEVRVGDGPVHVVIAAADQMFNDITPDETGRMPTWTGDLELINHSAGSLTSEAFHKREVTKNEVLAESAEEASVAAAWLGARPYPQQRLDDTWMLALAQHFHDTAAGTATPRAYQFAWNDDIIVSNQFAGVFTDASEAVASALDTNGAGTPIVVFNSLNIPREDLVTATVAGISKSVRVVDPAGAEVPSQVVDGKVVFLAKTPSVGYAVYHVAPGAAAASSALSVTASTLENARYKVAVNSDGDVSSVFDKQLNKELLAAPIRLAISNDTPKQWPAWNMDFDQEQAAPRAYVSGPAKIRIVENGPVRVALEVSRDTENSHYVQTISLAAGDAGNRVEFSNAIDWKTLAANLKVVFPLAASNPNATYNWDVGTVQRPNAFDRQFEVASHRWIDLTDASGSFGTTLLTDCKNGSDKRNDNTIRVTLLRSPGIAPKVNYSDQANQDWGHHEFTFGLTGHAGDWRAGQTDWQAYRLNAPLVAFETSKHGGSLGKSFSLVHVDNPRIRVLAVKKDETTDETVIRLVEMDGKPARNVQIAFAAPVTNIREIDAQEQHLATPNANTAQIGSGAVVATFGGYEPRTFAVSFGKPKTALASVKSQPVTLSYDLAAATNDDTATPNGGFDGKGNAMPAEMLPTQLAYDGVQFQLAPAGTGKADALTAKGQTIALPAGTFNRVYVLAASSDGDRKATFKVGAQAHELTVEAWNGFVGQWDTRLWKLPLDARDWAISANHAVWPPTDMRARESYVSPSYPGDYVGLEPGYVKPAAVAWYASHHHTAAGLNEPYQYSYLFAYPIDIPAGAKSIVLPNDSSIRIFAITVAKTDPTLTPAQPLFDTLNRTEPVSK
jgi:alpha-mannosidase